MIAVKSNNGFCVSRKKRYSMEAKMEMGIQAQEANIAKKVDVPYTELTEKSEFQKLIKQKKAFILPMVIFFFVFYFSLPTLAAYTQLLNFRAFGPITWAWIYALLQFVLVWVSGIIYIKKSKHYDELAKNILIKYKEELN